MLVKENLFMKDVNMLESVWEFSYVIFTLEAIYAPPSCESLL